MSTNRQNLEIERQGIRIPRVGMIIAVFLLILAILILLDSWSRSRNLASPIEILLGTPQGSSNDVIVFSQGDITVYMPPGATELEGTISIAAAELNLSLMVNDTGWIPSKVVKVEFRSMEGAPIPGVAFSKPLEICFKLAEDLWQAFSQNPDYFRIQYFDNQSDPTRWAPLPQVTYPERSQLCGQTSRLSVFALAIHADGGIPVTGFTTSMPPAADLPSNQTHERRERNTSNDAGASQVIPTNPPPTQVPPTNLPATDPPPDQPPVIQPPVEQPPAEPPINEEQRRAEQEAREEQRRAEQQAREEQRIAEQQAREEQRRAEEEAREEQKKEKDKKQPDPSGSILTPFGTFTDSLIG